MEKNGANNLSMKSTPGGKKSKKAKSNSRQNLSTGRSRKLRCGECEGCKSQNCGICIYCKDSKRFGGPGKLKQACKERICENKSLSNNKSYSKNASPPGKKSSVKNTKLKKYSSETSKNSAPILPSKDDGESQSMNEFRETDPEINSSKENTDSILNPKIIQEEPSKDSLTNSEIQIDLTRKKFVNGNGNEFSEEIQIDNARNIDVNEFSTDSVQDEKNKGSDKPSIPKKIINEEFLGKIRAEISASSGSATPKKSRETKRSTKMSKILPPIVESDEEITNEWTKRSNLIGKYKPKPKSKQNKTMHKIEKDLEIVVDEMSKEETESEIISRAKSAFHGGKKFRENDFKKKSSSKNKVNKKSLQSTREDEISLISDDEVEVQETKLIKISSKKSSNDSNRFHENFRENDFSKNSNLPAPNKEDLSSITEYHETVSKNNDRIPFKLTKYHNDRPITNTETPKNTGLYSKNLAGKNTTLKVTKDQNKYLKASFDANPFLIPKVRNMF